MEDSVAKAGEVADTITNTLENLSFVVAAFGKAVGIGDIKSIKNVLAPVVNGSGALVEFRKMGVFGTADPTDEQFFSNLGVGRVHKEKEVVFQAICLLQPGR